MFSFCNLLWIKFILFGYGLYELKNNLIYYLWSLIIGRKSLRMQQKRHWILHGSHRFHPLRPFSIWLSWCFHWTPFLHVDLSESWDKIHYHGFVKIISNLGQNGIVYIMMLILTRKYFCYKILAYALYVSLAHWYKNRTILDYAVLFFCYYFETFLASLVIVFFLEYFPGI